MNGHHAHRIAGARSVALDIHIAAVEPVDERLQGGRVPSFELQRGVQQLLDRIARLRPQPGEQLAPPIQRTGQHVLEKAVRRHEISTAQHLAQRGEQGRIACRLQMRPQADTLRAAGALVQFVLGPPDQRRNEQAGEIEIVKRLEDEADRGEQILHRQRRVEPQPIDPRHRHACGMQPGD